MKFLDQQLNWVSCIFFFVLFLFFFSFFCDSLKMKKKDFSPTTSLQERSPLKSGTHFFLTCKIFHFFYLFFIFFCSFFSSDFHCFVFFPPFSFFSSNHFRYLEHNSFSGSVPTTLGTLGNGGLFDMFVICYFCFYICF